MKCKTHGCEGVRTATNHLCVPCSIEHAQELADAFDAAQEWACDDTLAAERAWDEGAS